MTTVLPIRRARTAAGHTEWMPEGLEVEIWTRAARVLLGRRIAGVRIDPRCGGEGAEALRGARIEDVTRRAKTMVIHTEAGLLGVHFGMTGRLVVDGVSAIAALEYASAADRPEWDRCLMTMADGGSLRVNDPRRWSRYAVLLGSATDNSRSPDPMFGPFGPDALEISARDLRGALAGRHRSLKACLLDQHCVAGVGNMCADEVFYQAALDPRRRADSLTPAEVTSLARVMRRTLATMLAAGGSHRGELSADLRRSGGVCPRDGAPLARAHVAGRTTWWCPAHQVGDADLSQDTRRPDMAH